MRTTGKGLYKWLKTQQNVRWPQSGGGFLVYLDYNGVKCAGIIGKTFMGTKLVRTDITIRPLQSTGDIGIGAGAAVHMTFEKNANIKK